MKFMRVIACCCVLLSLTAFAQKKSSESTTLKDRKDKVSYSIGSSIGKNFKAQELDLNIDALIQGLRDQVGGGKLLMEDQEMTDTLMSFQKSNMEHQKEVQKKKAEKATKEGEDFLAANKKKDSVVTLPSGLQYKILVQGTGRKPLATDTVTVNYRGTLIDGTEFDNSFKRGQPATFPINHVIKGWTEALQLMPIGSRWMLYIPADLAYAQQPPTPAIPPNSVLVFDVELISAK